MASIRANARKIACIGRNYADHIKELNNARPKQPFFFLKPPSSLLLPNAGSVLRPRGVKLHYEVELALVVGKQLRDVRPDDKQQIYDSIDGYCLAIDMSARNVQDEAKRKGLPWSIAKGFDTFCPISEYLAKSQVPDPQNVDLSLAVNGQVRQQDNTNLMLFPIPRLVSEISQVMTLEPGDLVLTGTPKGVGSVGAGDVMEADMKVNGSAVAWIKVPVEDRDGPYEFKET